MSADASLNVRSCSHLKHHAGFFQQICSHVGADDTVAIVEANLNVFPKAAAVVIPGGLCISDGLEDKGKTKTHAAVMELLVRCSFN